jgi:hypothetical protein
MLVQRRMYKGKAKWYKHTLLPKRSWAQ